MLAASTVLGAAWAVALALVDGVHGLVASVGLRSEYLIDVGRVGSPGAFLRGFVSQIATFHVHVQGHPPGFLLILWGLDRVGLAQPGWVATLEITVGVLAISAVLLAVRNVAGETAACAAAPFVACAPVAIWVATSSDAFYAGVSVWAVALVVLATARRDRRGDLLALAGGVLFGVTVFLSYGLVLLAIVPATVAWRRRRVRPLAFAVLGASPVFLAFAVAGFWWFDGLAATRRSILRWSGGASPLRRVPDRRPRVFRDRARPCDRSCARATARSAALVGGRRGVGRGRFGGSHGHVERGG